jgi:glyceraldehyde 3-phosphate dehydrogenase
MTIKIGINGLGRIGRCVARALVQEGYDDIQLVAANGSAANEYHAHLLEFDSVHGKFPGKISYDDAGIDMGRGKFTVTHERDPNALRWDELGVDIVLECTGAFNSKAAASVHLARGAKRVLISAPASDECPTFVYGVNTPLCSSPHRGEVRWGADAGSALCGSPPPNLPPMGGGVPSVFSVGSCTTNCLAPVAKVINDAFGIESGYMTTIHAYTGDQNLVDGSHKDLRRARAAAMSMVPTKTGAAKAIGLVLPALAGKLSGTAIRVPTANVSMIDLTVITSKTVAKESVNDALTAAASGAMKRVLKVDSRPLVSIDYSGDNASAIVDLTGTAVVGGNLLRVAAWYDNEWGFSCRMLDMVRVAGCLPV